VPVPRKADEEDAIVDSTEAPKATKVARLQDELAIVAADLPGRVRQVARSALEAQVEGG
jgi:hypothetical protein